ISDAYPMSGFGLSALLVALGIFRPSDYFPFGVFQLAALAPLIWIALRALSIRPTLGRFIGFYTSAFFAFAFLARFFAHNYVATLVALACCVLPLAGIPLQSGDLAPAQPGPSRPLRRTAAAAGAPRHRADFPARPRCRPRPTVRGWRRRR